MKVNPTRMELLKLKKRITLAQRGHKLLKDKEEQLLVEFRKLIFEVRKRRKQIEQDLNRFYTHNLTLRGITGEKEWKELLYNPYVKTVFSSKTIRVFNIPVVKIDVTFEPEKNPLPCSTPVLFHFVFQSGKIILKELAELATLENKLRRFAEEIERTRRRVNALEYVLIPNIKETIKFITFKLSEAERASLVRLKHIQLIKS